MGTVSRRVVRLLGVLALIASVLVIASCANRASNDSERTGQEDVVEVKPNQTAYQIPATAGNFSSQEKLNAVKYLEEKKVALKRITINKDLVGGKYVPNSFVILVDRTPVARQWTKESSTGTTAANEALCTESGESINLCFQISLSASVEEGNASIYLYHYPTTKLQNDQVAGVYIATPLDQVVDNQVRQYIQKTIAAEAAKRTLLEVIAQKSAIVSLAETATIQYFKDQGITIAYAGLGGPILLDDPVQEAINQRFVVQTQATTTAIQVETEKQAAITRAQGDAAVIHTLQLEFHGDPDQLARLVEILKWNGSRASVIINGNQSGLPVSIAVPTSTPVPEPTAVPTPKK